LLSRTITFRRSTAADHDSFLPLLRRDAASPLSAKGFMTHFENGEYSYDRTWIAVDGAGDVVAVAVWWARPGETEPGALDAVYMHESVGGAERVALAADLLRAGQQAFADEFGSAEPPDFHVFVPGDWREQPEVVEALEWRREAAERAGLGALLERLRFEWTTEDQLVVPDRGLEFHAEPDDEVFVDLFTRVLQGSLDTTSTREAAQIGAVEQAREDLVHLRDLMLGERSWWRMAVNADGDVVGFGIPSRNPAVPVVGYIGVLPEHRGHGYVDAILAEITRILVAEADATTIRADTDLVNLPMAEAFLRVGYRNHARRLVFSAS
jgi:RimJ/RimL family protein N-acetyltransferase